MAVLVELVVDHVVGCTAVGSLRRLVRVAACVEIERRWIAVDVGVDAVLGSYAGMVVDVDMAGNVVVAVVVVVVVCTTVAAVAHAAVVAVVVVAVEMVVVVDIDVVADVVVPAGSEIGRAHV